MAFVVRLKLDTTEEDVMGLMTAAGMKDPRYKKLKSKEGKRIAQQLSWFHVLYCPRRNSTMKPTGQRVVSYVTGILRTSNSFLTSWKFCHLVLLGSCPGVVWE